MIQICFTLALLNAIPPISRVHYRIDFWIQDEHFVAALVLNHLSDQSFSISCRKAPGGGLFSFWATPKRNTIWLPKAKTAFQGKASQTFQLFPKGPQLNRQEWLELLLHGTFPKSSPTLELQKQNGWLALSDPRHNFKVRWRETRRTIKKRYKAKVLKPHFKKPVQLFALKALAKYWESHHDPPQEPRQN